MALSKEDIQAALDEAAGGGEKLSEYVDQRIVVTGFVLKDGQYGEYAVITAVNSEGEEITISSGGTVVLPQLKKLKELEAFPCEITVTSFPGQFGKPGYRLES